MAFAQPRSFARLNEGLCGEWREAELLFNNLQHVPGIPGEANEAALLTRTFRLPMLQCLHILGFLNRDARIKVLEFPMNRMQSPGIQVLRLETWALLLCYPWPFDHLAHMVLYFAHKHDSEEKDCKDHASSPGSKTPGFEAIAGLPALQTLYVQSRLESVRSD